MKIPNPPGKSKISIIKLIIIFVCVFGGILLLINLPAFINSIHYSLTHSEDTDNEALTEQYRSLYGYDNHPELSYTSPQHNTVQASQVNTTSSYVPENNNQTVISSTESLSIPKLELSVPVVIVPSGDDNAILAALKNGVVQFPGSADPGQSGMTVIVGHSSSTAPWNKYSSVFSQLDKLQTNDLIYIDFNGQKYTYRVVAKRKGSAQEILDSGITGDLLLSTCWPVGTDTNRIAVAAMRLK